MRCIARESRRPAQRRACYEYLSPSHTRMSLTAASGPACGSCVRQRQLTRTEKATIHGEPAHERVDRLFCMHSLLRECVTCLLLVAEQKIGRRGQQRERQHEREHRRIHIVQRVRVGSLVSAVAVLQLVQSGGEAMAEHQAVVDAGLEPATRKRSGNLNINVYNAIGAPFTLRNILLNTNVTCSPRFYVCDTYLSAGARSARSGHFAETQTPRWARVWSKWSIQFAE